MKIQLCKKLSIILVCFIGTYCINAQQKPGINVELMDKTVKPGDDFFKYVNGKWVETTEIPSDRVRWGSFDELRQNTDRDALAILKEAGKNPKYKATTDQGKAINLFKTAR